MIGDYYTFRNIDRFAQMNCKTVSSLTIMSLLAQAAMALRFLKNIHMTRCHLKWSNVLFTKGYVLKLSDFGKARINSAHRHLVSLSSDSMDRHPGFTLPYSPPEAFSQPINLYGFGHKYDVYSYGVMLLELLFGCFPIQMRNQSAENLIRALMQGTYRQLVLANVGLLSNYMAGQLGEILCHIALPCIDPDPQKRPCIDWLVVVVRSLHNYVEKSCS